jgi:hypothetical protein
VKAAKSQQIVPNDCRHCRDLGEERSLAITKPTALMAASHHAVLVEINLSRFWRQVL